MVVTAVVGSLGGAARTDSSVTKQRSIHEVTDGVYVIRYADAPDTFPQGNTTVVIGSRGLLVVDSAYLPSAAAEDLAQIRRWTARPVLDLLNTHWHPDHVRGNQTYAKAFQGMSIIAHRATAELVLRYELENLRRRSTTLVRLKAQLQHAEHAGAATMTSKERESFS